MRWILSVLLLFFLFIGCNKTNDLGLDNNLSGCPINSNCIYTYLDNADLSQNTGVVSGNFRVFNYQVLNSKICDLTTGLYFKVPIFNNNFVIDANQIETNNTVIYYYSCICCDFLANIHPIGGTIKGKIIRPNQWLINANVIVGLSNDKPLDTIVVNQYFTKK